MKLSNIISSDAYIPVNKHLAKILWIMETVLLCELIRQRERFREHEFYINQTEIAEQTSISKYQIRQCSEKLVSEWVISIQKKWIPATNHYVIIDERIIELLNQDELESQESSGKETAPLVVKKLHDKKLKNCTTSGKETKQHIVYNKKENKKENNKDNSSSRKIFIPPSLDEMKQYFREKWYREDVAEKAHQYYDSSWWFDSKWNKVKNRKQKMIWVRFRDENKIKIDLAKISMFRNTERDEDEIRKFKEKYWQDVFKQSIQYFNTHLN